MELDFAPIYSAKAKSTANAPRDKPIISREIQNLSGENRAKLEEAARIQAEYQKNILLSDGLRCEINKGLKAGDDISDLFLKAVKAISLMTGDTAFYDVTKKDLLAIYGVGLEKSPVLQIELNETQARLDKLRQAAEREQDTDDIARIKTAIQYHEQAAERIKSKIVDQIKEDNEYDKRPECKDTANYFAENGN